MRTSNFLITLFSLSTLFSDHPEIRYELIDEKRSYIDELAKLRLEVFQEYPYLYEGTLEEERDYLQQYLESKDSIFMAAMVGSSPIGMVTGIPLKDTFSDFQAPFVERDIPIDSLFYVGEVVLKKEYRGQHIGETLCLKFEESVKAISSYDALVACMIVRPEEQFPIPADYFSFDDLLKRKGCTPMEGVTALFNWRDVGQEEPSPHFMQYWKKPLRNTCEITEFSFILKPSPIEGIGVFAAHDIPKGTKVPSYQTFCTRTRKVEEVPEKFLKYCVLLNETECACPENFDRMPLGCYVNHSDNPNLAKHSPDTRVALRDIQAGEEILVDYNELDEPEELKPNWLPIRSKRVSE